MRQPTWMPAACMSSKTASARCHCPPRSSAEMSEPYVMRSGLAGALPAYTAAALASLSLSLPLPSAGVAAAAAGEALPDLLGAAEAAERLAVMPLRRPPSLPTCPLPLLRGVLPLLLLLLLLPAPAALLPLVAALLAAALVIAPLTLTLQLLPLTAPLLLLLPPPPPLPSPLPPPCMAWNAARARSHCPPRPSAEMSRL